MRTTAEAAGIRVLWAAGSASLSRAGSGRCRGTGRMGLLPPAPTTSALLSSSSLVCSRPATAGDWKPRAPGRGKPAPQGRSPTRYLGLLGWPQGESSRRRGCRGWLKVSRPAGRRHPAEGTSGSWGSQAQGARATTSAAFWMVDRKASPAEPAAERGETAQPPQSHPVFPG